MGVLYNRLLNALNEELMESVYYHIALTMLRNFSKLQELSIKQLADLCTVSKATISRFVRYLGYEDFADFHYASIIRNHINYRPNSYSDDVMRYIENNSLDSYILAVQHDIHATYKKLDWSMIDRLVKDIWQYKKVAAFGWQSSGTAALDFQLKMVSNKKIITTNLNDLKQDQYIKNAEKDTLIIIFSDSGDFLDRYHQIPDFKDKHIFNRTRAKIVVITSNRDMAQDSRIDYCIFYQRTEELHTHRVVYSILTDIISYKYRKYIQKENLDYIDLLD